VDYLNYLSVSLSNETGKSRQIIALPYPTRSTAVGNEPRNNQVRRFGRGILESTPTPVKILMFAEVGYPERRLVLVLDAIDGFAIVGGIVNKLLGARVVVVAGRVAVGK
jgi:hypothetical protein